MSIPEALKVKYRPESSLTRALQEHLPEGTPLDVAVMAALLVQRHSNEGMYLLNEQDGSVAPMYKRDDIEGLHPMKKLKEDLDMLGLQAQSHAIVNDCCDKLAANFGLSR